MKLGGDRGAVLTSEAKAKGVEVRVAKANDRAADLLPIIAEIRAAGASSLRQITDALNAKGISTARGGRWSAVQVQRVEARV